MSGYNKKTWKDGDLITVEALNNMEEGIAAARMVTDNLLNAVYPVGSIYTSVNDVSPAAIFGGTWERISGKFLLSASTAYPAGTTGGEAEHTLTEDEMPAHRHMYSLQNPYAGTVSTAASGLGTTTVSEIKLQPSGVTSGPTGGNKPHNNMPPYLSVNVWKRTA